MFAIRFPFRPVFVFESVFDFVFDLVLDLVVVVETV